MLDAITIVSLFGSPAGYIVVGFGLYKVYSRIVQTERYAKRANHNSDTILKVLIKHGLLDDEDLKEYEFSVG